MRRLVVKRRDERGVYAVLFGLLVLVLASVAALAVDVGNAVARKGDVQAQADFAALGAGAQLDANDGPITTAVLDEARTLLNKNRALNWGDDCSSGPMCIASNVQLTNGNLEDGEVRLANGGLQVLTPFERVEYGLAKVMGFDNVDVQGHATVRIGSFGFLSIPAYAVNPCDYGRQVLTDPASGQAVPITPPSTLADFGQSNSTDLDSVTPTQVAYNADATQPQPQVSLTGQKFKRTTHVGFFNATGLVHTYSLPNAPLTQNGNHTINGIVVPLAVTASEEVWYLRVLNDEANTPGITLDDTWSTGSDAIPLRVGNAVLECDSDVFGGNFGTLRMDRNDEEAEELARNFAEGFEEPINVVPHVPVNGSTEVVGGLCSHGDAYGSVESSESNSPIFIGFNSNTDCVKTDPGLPANAVADGLVRGGSGFTGRLTNKPTRPGCSPDNESDPLRVSIQGPYDINNEVLSCYLTDAAMPVSTIAAAGYNSGPALHSDIWDSPRFTMVPVLGVQPSTGLGRYSVVELRPAFITDEALTSTRGNSTATGSGASCTEFCNGLRIESNDVTQLTVIFFNIDALPPDPDGDIIDYLGDGPKAIQMID